MDSKRQGGLCSFPCFHFELGGRSIPSERSRARHRVALAPRRSLEHHLLHLTGERTEQPVADGDVHVLLNGEIYNWRSFGARSEAGAVLQAYRRLGGAAFAPALDGEFAQPPQPTPF